MATAEAARMVARMGQKGTADMDIHQNCSFALQADSSLMPLILIVTISERLRDRVLVWVVWVCGCVDV